MKLSLASKASHEPAVTTIHMSFITISSEICITMELGTVLSPLSPLPRTLAINWNLGVVHFLETATLSAPFIANPMGTALRKDWWSQPIHT
jgi:hypothetical protein